MRTAIFSDGEDQGNESWDLRLALGRSSHKLKTVYIGTDLVNSNRQLWDGRYNKRFSRYECVEQLYQRCSEFILTHEHLHLIITDLENKKTSNMFDNIDGELQISEN